MRRAHDFARMVLITLLCALALASGVSFVIWQAPVIQADILADD